MLDFRLFGIRFSVSVGFLGLLCLMLYIDKSGLMLPTLLSTLFHEFGHLLSLLMLNLKPKGVVFKVGAISIIGSFALNTRGELFLNLAGPILNFLLFFIFFGCYLILGTAFTRDFALINLVLGVFNLLPVTGLDGGSIVSILLLKILKPLTANTVCIIISAITILLIFILGVNVFYTTKTNPSLILLSLYLVLGLLISKKQNSYCNIFKNRVK
ncbi:MAG: site-2 protease family protein [Clostridia bacterium]|nr:site-2 protease family protein [Clostridia bacterium]